MSVPDEVRKAMNHVGLSFSRIQISRQTENAQLLQAEVWLPDDWVFIPPTFRVAEIKASVTRKDVEKLIEIAEAFISHASVRSDHRPHFPICAQARDTVRSIGAKLGG